MACAKKLRITVLILWPLLGCRDAMDKGTKNRPPAFPVRGIVQLDGKPVEGATVNFIPEEGTHAAYALTDPAGRFILTTFKQGDGAPAGRYHVTIRKTVLETTPNPNGPDYPAKIVKETAIVPANYSDPKTSNLEFEVKSGGDKNVAFDLKH